MTVSVEKTQNEFHDNFFMRQDQANITTFELRIDSLISLKDPRKDTIFANYATIELKQGKFIQSVTWKHSTYFIDYLANQGGLVTSLLGITAFVMAGY